MKITFIKKAKFYTDSDVDIKAGTVEEFSSGCLNEALRFPNVRKVLIDKININASKAAGRILNCISEESKNLY